jgi:hypothetical protein
MKLIDVGLKDEKVIASIIHERNLPSGSTVTNQTPRTATLVVEEVGSATPTPSTPLQGTNQEEVRVVL